MPRSHPHWAAFPLLLAPTLVLGASKSDYVNYALNASDVMNQVWYDSSNGQWQDLWWNSANALTAIADLAAIDSNDFSSTAEYYFSTTFAQAKASNGGSWLNDFYDDEGWWALAWIKAYDVTGNGDYLSAAQDIFEDLLTGNDATCGGHWWDKPHTSNTAIGNSLYMNVGASLANRVSDKKDYYQGYAKSEANWFLNSGLINGENTVTDNLDLSSCTPNGPDWTYNSGSVIGAFIELSKLTGDSSYLDKAGDIAQGAMNYLSNDGILTEPSSPNLDANSGEFKGVFVRNLGYLQAARGDSSYVSFLQQNADSIWANARDGSGQIGSQWQGPFDSGSMVTQSAALECLVAAAAVS